MAAEKRNRNRKQQQKPKQNKHSANYIRAEVCLTVGLTVCLSVHLFPPPLSVYFESSFVIAAKHTSNHTAKTNKGKI